MFYIIIESTHIHFILKNKLIEYQTKPVITSRKDITLDLINLTWLSNFSLDNTTFHYLMLSNEYLSFDILKMPKLNYLEIYEILTNINVNTFLLWSQLYLSTAILRLSFIFNAKYFTMYTGYFRNLSTTLFEYFNKFYWKLCNQLYSFKFTIIIFKNSKFVENNKMFL